MTWDTFKTHLTEAYFEIKENNELNKKHVGFVAYETTDKPHVEEAYMNESLNNLVNSFISDATNLANLKTKNANLAEQLKVSLAQNKVLPELLRKKILGVPETHSDNQTPNKWQRNDNTRGHYNRKSTEVKWWYLFEYCFTHIYKF